MRATITVVALAQILLYGQSSEITVPQRCARTPEGFSDTVTAELIRVPFAETIGFTDLIVRGVITAAGGRLTKDEVYIETVYQVASPQILFSTVPVQQTAQRPGVPSPLTFTMMGGSVVIGKCKASLHFQGVPVLQPGTEVIALLDRHNRVVNEGIFEARGAQTLPLVTRQGEHQEFRGKHPTDVMRELVERRNKILR